MARSRRMLNSDTTCGWHRRWSTLFVTVTGSCLNSVPNIEQLLKLRVVRACESEATGRKHGQMSGPTLPQCKLTQKTRFKDDAGREKTAAASPQPPRSTASPQPSTAGLGKKAPEVGAPQEDWEGAICWKKDPRRGSERVPNTIFVQSS